MLPGNFPAVYYRVAFVRKGVLLHRTLV